MANNSYSERIENGLYTSASLLWKAIEYFDANKAADILYEMYKLVNDITEFSDVAVDISCTCCSYLSDLLINSANSFSKEKTDRYTYIVD